MQFALLKLLLQLLAPTVRQGFEVQHLRLLPHVDHHVGGGALVPAHLVDRVAHGAELPLDVVAGQRQQLLQGNLLPVRIQLEGDRSRGNLDRSFKSCFDFSKISFTCVLMKLAR